MINEFLSGKLASASLKTPIVEGGLRPSTLNEIEKWWNEIGQARLIIEQSRAWKPAAQHESSYAGLPPPRPGGRVQLTGLSSRQELNGVRGTLMQFVEDAGRWAVLTEAGRLDSETIRVKLENIIILPDIEPFDDPEEGFDFEWHQTHDPDPSNRLSWAEEHPLQARALGFRFDESHRIVNYLPPRRKLRSDGAGSSAPLPPLPVPANDACQEEEGEEYMEAAF